MTEKNSPFVNLVKKAVGLPTSQSSCCGSTATQSSCCATSAQSEQTTKGSCCD